MTTMTGTHSPTFVYELDGSVSAVMAVVVDGAPSLLLKGNRHRSILALKLNIMIFIIGLAYHKKSLKLHQR